MSKGMLLVDFDGTVVKHAFPEIGEPLPDAFEVLRELKEAGWALILWTCREDQGRNINKRYLTDAVEFCRSNGVEFDAVNETMLEHDFRDEGTLMRKPHASYVIDDRNLGGFPGWGVVRRALIERAPVRWVCD